MRRRLCENPDCGAFLDRKGEGVRFVDRDSGKVVILCAECVAYVDRTRCSKYRRIQTPPEGSTT